MGEKNPPQVLGKELEMIVIHCLRLSGTYFVNALSVVFGEDWEGTKTTAYRKIFSSVTTEPRLFLGVAGRQQQTSLGFVLINTQKKI